MTVLFTTNASSSSYTAHPNQVHSLIFQARLPTESTLLSLTHSLATHTQGIRLLRLRGASDGFRELCHTDWNQRTLFRIISIEDHRSLALKGDREGNCDLRREKVKQKRFPRLQNGRTTPVSTAAQEELKEHTARGASSEWDPPLPRTH